MIRGVNFRQHEIFRQHETPNLYKSKTTTLTVRFRCTLTPQLTTLPTSKTEIKDRRLWYGQLYTER